MNKIEKKKKGKGVWIRRIILIVAICVFLVSGIQLGKIIWQQHQNAKEVDSLYELVDYNKKTDLNSFNIDFDKLRKINPEIVGWIVVKDTSISLPVVQGKDNTTYLHKTFKGYDNYNGAIFMDASADSTFNRPFENIFIYGHNVKDGDIRMFAELEKYCDKKTGKKFFEKHPYVYYYTPHGNYKLKVFSAYAGDGNLQGQRQFNDAQSYEAYIKQVEAKSRYKTGVKMDANDKMMTLYTCSYEDNNPFVTGYDDKKRYYIHCKLIKALNSEMPKNINTDIQ